MKKIWIKLFDMNEKKYCYDVGTNNIMQITPPMHDVLLRYNYTNREQVKKDLSSKYSEEDISEAIRRVEEFSKDQGGFILERRIRLKFPFNKEEYEYLLENFLSHLILNITEDCNLRCHYCSFGGSYKYFRTHNKASMPWSVIKKAVDFFFPRCKLRISELKRSITIGFYGGEPLLEHKKMFKTVEYIKEKYPDIFPEVSFAISSNGTLLTREIIEKLIQYNFVLAVSLDGPQEIQDRNRVFKGGGDTYNTVMKNLALVKSIDSDYYKRKVFFCATVAPPYNFREMIDFFKKESEDQEGSSVFNMVDPFDTTYFDQFDMVEERKKHTEQSNELIWEFIDKKSCGEEDRILSSFLKENYIDMHQRKVFELPESTFPNGCCLPAIKKLFVDTNGRFHLCEKGSLNFSYGDVDSGMSVKKMFDFVDRYIESSNHCKYCWAIRFCDACFLTSIEGDRFSVERKMENCEGVRARILSRIKIYINLLERNPEPFKEPYELGEDMVEELVEFMNNRKAKGQISWSKKQQIK